jgi:hypothetical protein
MYCIFILWFILQIFSSHFCQENNSFNDFSQSFTLKNFSTVLNEFQDQLLSSNITYNCNISITISFREEEGRTQARCYNATENRTNDWQFDMIMTINNNRSSYHSRAYHICLFNNSCNRSFIKDWISWQKNAINNTVQSENNFKKVYFLDSIEFQIWGSLYYNQTFLCYNITSPNNTVSETVDNVTIDTEVNNTGECLSYTYNNENIESNISTLIIEFNDALTRYSSFNGKKSDTTQGLTTVLNIHSTNEDTLSFVNTTQSILQGVTTMINKNKVGDKYFLKLFILVMNIIVTVVLLVVCIVCFIYSKRYRDGYRPAATS